MWSVIKEEWPGLFAKDSKLMSKVGLICLTRFVCSMMKTRARKPHLRSQVDPGDPDKVKSVTRDILNTLILVSLKLIEQVPAMIPRRAETRS